MEKIFFKTTDNLKLCGIHEQNSGDLCVILCHGIRGNKEEVGNFTKLVEKLNKLKIDSFRFDFRGHGESEGEFIDVTISKEVEDLQSAIDYVNNKNYKNIILLGASFGAISVALIDYSKYKNIKSIVFWYPALKLKKTDLFTKNQYNEAKKIGYAEIWNLAHTKSFKLGIKLMEESFIFKPWKKIEKNELPKLFIHGDCDKNVEIKSNSIKPSKKSPNSQLEIIKGGVHNFSRSDLELVNKGINLTIDFIKRNA